MSSNDSAKKNGFSKTVMIFMKFFLLLSGIFILLCSLLLLLVDVSIGLFFTILGIIFICISQRYAKQLKMLKDTTFNIPDNSKLLGAFAKENNQKVDDVSVSEVPEIVSIDNTFVSETPEIVSIESVDNSSIIPSASLISEQTIVSKNSDSIHSEVSNSVSEQMQTTVTSIQKNHHEKEVVMLSKAPSKSTTEELLYKTGDITPLFLKNPADFATPPEVPKHEAEFFEIDEVIAIGKALKEKPLKWQTITNLLIDTGARRGEIMGLKWKNVSFSKSEIIISNNLQYTSEKGLYDDSPKNDECRTISILTDSDTVILVPCRISIAIY